MLDHPDTQGPLRRSILIAMMRLCSESGTHPRCLTLQHIRYDTRPVAAGQFGEVWKGYIGDKRVCLKVPKLYQDTQIERLLKNSTREGIMWSDLKHPNLLPFYGIYHLGDDHGRVCLVSPWMDNGSVSDYLRANPEVPHLPLVSDVLAGLGHLHAHSIVHGDLKGANILISSSGLACLADFGLSSIVDAEILRWTSLETTSRIGGTIRWEAPELMDFEDGGIPRPTFPSDVYSLASVMYEILTDRIPYHEFPRDVTILSKVMRGVKPSKPSDFEVELSDEIWAIMEECWNHDPAQRPTVSQAATRWNKISPPPLTTRRMSQNQGRRSEDNLQALDSQAFRAVVQGFDTKFSESDINLLRKYAHRDERQ
ncbi:kinase-like protein, partial [Macrolepiota fuliginosa MF-IS2]